MTIAEARDKCKGAVAKVPRDIWILAVLIGASLASFGLGYLAGQDAGGVGQGSPLILEESPLTSLPANALTNATSSPQAGQVVASKNGTKYYLPSCAGASRISDANKVRFASAAVATSAGYTPAANCKGL